MDHKFFEASIEIYEELSDDLTEAIEAELEARKNGRFHRGLDEMHMDKLIERFGVIISRKEYQDIRNDPEFSHTMMLNGMIEFHPKYGEVFGC